MGFFICLLQTVLADDEKMADTSQQEELPQTNGVVDGLTEEEKSKMRPADIDAVSILIFKLYSSLLFFLVIIRLSFVLLIEPLSFFSSVS